MPSIRSSARAASLWSPDRKGQGQSDAREGLFHGRLRSACTVREPYTIPVSLSRKGRIGPMEKFTLGIAQLAPALGNLDANLALHDKILREAEGQGVDLLLFPELSLTGYFLKDLVPSVALTPRDPRLDLFKHASRRMAIVVGLVEESSGRRFFAPAAHFEGGKVAHLHRQPH